MIPESLRPDSDSGLPTLPPPATVRLSSLRVGDVLKFPYNTDQFIVRERFSEDRSSGGTVIANNYAVPITFLWDHEDPEVVYLGRGRLESRIVIEPASGPPA